MSLMLLVALLAGCSDSADDPSEEQADSTEPLEADAGPEDEGQADSEPASSEPASQETSGNTTENQPPVLEFHASSLEGFAPFSVEFTINGTDPEGDALTWSLAIQNGSEIGAGDLEGSVVINHTFDSPGDYIVDATIADDGFEVAANLTLTVLEAPPVEPTGPVYDNAESWIAGGYGCALISTAPDGDNEGIFYASLRDIPTIAAGKAYTAEFSGDVAPDAFYVFRFYDAGNTNLVQVFGDPGVTSFSGVVPAGSDWFGATGCGVDGATVQLTIE